MKLNINNEPQDGRYSFTVNDRKVDVRVSDLPTEYGETFVCRLLDSKRPLLILKWVLGRKFVSYGTSCQNFPRHDFDYRAPQVQENDNAIYNA